MPQIRVVDVSHSFHTEQGDFPVLKPLDFIIEREQFLSILGPSGCGKTTLLKILAGLIQPSAGGIQHEIDGEAVDDLRVGMMFQQANLMPWRTIVENVLLPLQLKTPRLHRSVMVARAISILETVGLCGYENMRINEISGGMAQRVALARAMIHDPQLLLLDEPFGSLDALTRESMGEELLRVWQTHKKTVVMVTHSVSEAILLSDRVIVFSRRPSSIVLDIEIKLPRPREAGIRYSAEFSEYSAMIHTSIAQ
ncbi:MAG: ABC transporter ATP-binding protein [Anaerolineae bacterium]|nr:ABC transporter ATP-binding protein [Anaerolineae bacterium]